ncbi:hypothetical protein [Enterococcus rivorum]|uniref:GGDEF domain-containing protein n=1 Tax=Enterococcus rivorum TaxID=762845 RepID=A0A1E5L0S4_9ENTE|nr:hypothetical protein [Enterococcus rivorum]MBP2098464.1 uncharacterized membrane protein (DUF485 family) [Enterococcus rivorum]OEH83684.1 hypothetical protein BCR26_08435 [Enterococcus rivorum]
MNKQKVQTDLSLLFFLLLQFITIVFVGFTGQQLMMNVTLASVALILAIVTYFTDITMGMILNLIYLFIQGGYTIYLVVSGEKAFQYPFYFWLVMTPLFSIAVAFLTYSMRVLKDENETLNKNMDIARVNAENHLRTLVAFKDDHAVFSSVAERYAIPYRLIGIRLNFWYELEHLLTNKQIKDVEQLVIKSIDKARSGKGLVYILDEENLTFGILIYQNEEEVNQIIQKIKAAFEEEAPKSVEDIAMSIRVSSVAFDKDTMDDSFGFMNEMIKELEYDV